MSDDDKKRAQEEEPENTEQQQEQEEDKNKESLEEAFEKARQEAEEYKDKYLRAHADFENTKKRLEREKMTAVSYANEAFAKDILAVLDSFEAALKAIDEAADKEEESSELFEKLKEGVKLTYEQLKKTLKKHGIEEISCEGEFDPQVHQAVMQVESDEVESGQIAQVMQKGYTIKERVLRPALVATAK